jgi:hypothetical protein
MLACEHPTSPAERDVGFGIQRVAGSVGQFVPGSDLVQIAWLAKTLITPTLGSLIPVATSSS